jgi:hypothetical protein
MPRQPDEFSRSGRPRLATLGLHGQEISSFACDGIGSFQTTTQRITFLTVESGSLLSWAVVTGSEAGCE